MSGYAQFSRFSFPPVSVVLVDPATGLPMNQEGTSGAAHVLEQGNITGLRNPSSATNAYIPTRNEANATVLQTTAAPVTIGAGAANDTHLIGIHIHTALAGTLTIAGLLDDAGAARNYVLPIGTVGHIPFYAALNAAGALQMTLSAAGDAAKCLVEWRPA